ncbi:MAG: [protein-PII] uridylyltransferase [Saccharospirillaceae bacterium]|nr:[protein-PII] uridylyltransferase [Pseudomonadales bacterium]NRB80660.1 [protein-PII] uridylyltransferase [Saccharospirillaceae bacterium]
MTDAIASNNRNDSILVAAIMDIDHIESELQAGRSPITTYKQALKSLDDQLEQIFDPIQQIAENLYARSDALDKLLTFIWRSLIKDNKISLIAVGGFGRREMLPKSDIDLLLLFEDESIIEKNKSNIEQFLMQLWDIGLEIGSSVRTFEDCEREASQDITITTNLLETRLIIGNPSLFSKLSTRMRDDDICNSERFFTAKVEEQVTRHAKWDDADFSLEPNVKTGVGGLRDIQTIGWVAKRHFDDNHLKNLVECGFLIEEELEILLDCQNFLWKVRYQLHRITKKEEDRLLFDLQAKVAAALGFEDSNGLLAVEKMMKQYYRCVVKVSELNEILLQHFEEAILKIDPTLSIKAINEKFNRRNHLIDIKNEQVLLDDPSIILEIFVELCKDDSLKGVHSHTRRIIHQHLDLIDDDFRASAKNKEFFKRILCSYLGTSSNLRRMNRLGILGRFIPQFGRVIGQMQYDLFHIYTVDAHTLLTIRNIRKFRHIENTKKYPTATAVYHRLDRVYVLIIAALFHDLGKGRGGNHSEIGEKLVIEFCQNHDFDNEDTQLASWLVKNHLLMSLTSQRKDISDPEIIAEFAHEVGSIKRLQYLFILTVADISATNPKLWNAWRAELLRKLFNETYRALRRGLDNMLDRHEVIEHNKKRAVKLLIGEGFNVADIQSFWDNPGDNYFLRESPENIAWHFKEISATGLNKPKVLIKEMNGSQFNGATQIFVYAPDREKLFTDIATTLSNLNLSIQDARIITSTSSDFSLDTFIVLDENGESIGDNVERVKDIQSKLLMAIENPDDVNLQIKRISRAKKIFSVQTIVSHSVDEENDHSIIEVTSADRPGLLATCGRILNGMNLQLLNARIATLGERVEDIFFVQTQQRHSIKDPLVIKELCNKLKEALDKES